MQGGCAANVAVDCWRVPRTFCSVSWIDGTMSRAFLTLREDTITESQRLQANEVRSVGGFQMFQCFHVWGVGADILTLDFKCFNVFMFGGLVLTF